MKRAILTTLATLATLVVAAVVPAAAQDYPNKPIRILVAFAPGGAVDITARLVAQKLTEMWGQQVVVENRPGGGGTIAVNAVAQSPADGYTLLVAANAEIAANPVLFPNSAADPLKVLSPISLISVTPFLWIASPNSGLNTYEDMIARAKAQPGKLTWSSAGVGSTNHFAGAAFSSAAGIKMLHVPYKGAAPGSAAVAGGEVQVGVASPAAALSFIRAGKVKVLALTSKSKPSFATDWPSAHEKGLKDFDFAAWMGLFAPVNTPAPVLAKLNGAVQAMAKDADVRKRFLDIGMESVGNTAAEFTDRLKGDLVLYRKIADEAGIKAQQ